MERTLEVTVEDGKIWLWKVIEGNKKMIFSLDHTEAINLESQIIEAINKLENQKFRELKLERY